LRSIRSAFADGGGGEVSDEWAGSLCKFSHRPGRTLSTFAGGDDGGEVGGDGGEDGADDGGEDGGGGG
jgi:hypothetical protein